MYQTIDTYKSSLHTSIAIKYISLEHNNFMEESLPLINAPSQDVIDRLCKTPLKIIKTINNNNYFIIKFYYDNDKIGTFYSSIFSKYINREYHICKEINEYEQYYGNYIEELYYLKNYKFKLNDDNVQLEKSNGF